MPFDFAPVDILEKWIIFIEANLLCFTTVVPENYQIGSRNGVTVFIKLNSLI